MAIIGSARVAMPTAAGSASRKVSRRPQLSREAYSSALPSLLAFDSDGSRMVPSATPSIAVGNSIRRSAYCRAETAPAARLAAMPVLINRLIWAADTANTAGPIFLSMRRTPASRRPCSGLMEMRGSMPIFTSEGIWIATCNRPPTQTAIAIA